MSDHDDMRRDMMEERFTRSVNAATCRGQGGGCHNKWCLDCNPLPGDDTEDARDYLDEAERIAAGESRMLPERAHLDALMARKAFEIRVGEFILTDGNRAEPSRLVPGFTTIVTNEGLDVCEKGARRAFEVIFAELDERATPTGREMGNAE